MSEIKKSVVIDQYEPTPTTVPIVTTQPATMSGMCSDNATSYVGGSSTACNCGSNKIQMQSFGNGSFANSVCADGSAANPINLSCPAGIPKIHTNDNKRWWCNSTS